VFQHIYDAGIKVKVITGDNADTTKAIALQAGIINNAPAVNGSEVTASSEDDLMKLSEKTTCLQECFLKQSLKW
jgi:Ca2+-transporting ATPase